MKIDNRVNGKTKLMGVIGNPIEHSISPQLHNTISTQLGLNLIYVPFRVENKNLEMAIKGFQALNFIGFNITIPYKNDVMKFIDEISEEALLIGAVNTVKNMDGKLYGYNTDADGFARSFKEEAGSGFEDKNIVIIGAGGAARAMAVKVAFEGAKRVCIINRTLSKALDIAEIINRNIKGIATAYGSEEEKVAGVFKEGDIIINTTSIGMHPNTHSSPVGENMRFSSNQIVYDAIYNPVKTKFLQAAEQKGCKIVNGLGMLFYQGIFAYEIWTGNKLDENLIKDAYRSFLNILENR